ncbi:hypothetical protein KEM54_003894 [Ascosphaera aggregata]|nr:hypothetical protein KEM54_003894 [Ascosphaera aggregata]
MLGRLLNTAAASLNPAAHSTKNYPNQLESVTEEEHIAGLLFPATLNDNNLIITTDNSQQSPLHFNRYPSATAINHSGTSSYDDRGRLDPAPFRNFRLVIAQDALGDRDEPCILFDTERHGLNSKKSPLSAPTPTPTPTPAPATTPATATATAPRTGNAVSNNNPTIIPQRSKYPTLTHSPFHSASATQDTLRSTFRHPWRKETPDPPLTARPSALFSARRRNSPLLQSAQDADSYRVFSDASLLNCIFGSNAFTYRGSSTKMHILPQDADGSDEPDVAALKSPRFRADSVQSSSSSTGHHGSIPPHASATAAPGPNHHAFLRRETNGNDYRSSHPNEMTVMITRMFCINLHIDAHTPPETQSPAGPANASSPPPATAPRETKTPMFAVAITIKLPLPKTNSSGASTSTTTAGAGSYKNREFMSASVDSDHKWSKKN